MCKRKLKYGEKLLLSLLILAVLCVLVPHVIRYLGWKQLDDDHYVAQLVILIALVYSCVNSCIPLIFEYKDIENTAARSVAVIFGLLSAGIIPTQFLVVNGWCKELCAAGSLELLRNRSIGMTYIISSFLVSGGFAFAFVDDRMGKKYIARNVDFPFAISIFLLISCCLILSACYTSMDSYILGVGSGGMALQLIAANIIAPLGGRKDQEIKSVIEHVYVTKKLGWWYVFVLASLPLVAAVWMLKTI